MRVLSEEKIETIANEVGAPTSRYFPYWRTTVDLCRAIEAAVLEELAKQEPVALIDFAYWLSTQLKNGQSVPDVDVLAAKIHREFIDPQKPENIKCNCCGGSHGDIGGMDCGTYGGY